MPAMNSVHGTIESLDSENGKGDVVTDDGRRAFFYDSAFAGGGLKFAEATIGHRVLFDLQQTTSRGLRARNFRPPRESI